MENEHENAGVEERYNSFMDAAKPVVRGWIYYIFAALTVVVIIFTQLSAFSFAAVDWRTLVADAVPLFIATLMLDRTFYANGSAKGKATDKYIKALYAYSSKLSELTGRQLDALPEFCENMNFSALRNKQKAMLRPAVLSIEAFDDGVDDSPPIKTLTNDEIRKKFGKERARHIIAAKRAKIKRLTPERLTSEQPVKDVTDLGRGEKQNAAIQTAKRASMYIVTTILFAMIVVNDIARWGWAGIGLLLLKIAFALGGSIMSQIQGYNDITVSLVDHFARKTDILKQFGAWFDGRK